MKQGSRPVHSTESQIHREWSDRGNSGSVSSCVCGPLQLAWLGVPGHRYRVTGSEMRVRTVKCHKGFKGQSQDAH